MLAAECENENILKILLDHKLNVNYSTQSGQSAASIAWKSKNFKILLNLLQNNSPYPDKFNINEASSELQSFLENSIDFHKTIKTGNVENCLKFIDKFPNLHHFYVQYRNQLDRSLIENVIAIFLNKNNYILDN
jgi:hypothetical protein